MHWPLLHMLLHGIWERPGFSGSLCLECLKPTVNILTRICTLFFIKSRHSFYIKCWYI